MITLEGLNETHRIPVMAIYNHYVEHTHAAYPEQRVDESYFDRFLENARSLCGYAVLDANGSVIGFCQLKPHHPLSTFSGTVEITYFLAKEVTGQGIGTVVLERLTKEAKALGKRVLLASISADNQPSLRFHAKNGFVECGRFRAIGFKHGAFFDIVYMQKFI